jgi:hypothetical protein
MPVLQRGVHAEEVGEAQEAQEAQEGQEGQEGQEAQEGREGLKSWRLRPFLLDNCRRCFRARCCSHAL